MVKTKLALAYVLLALSSMRAGAQGSIAGTVYDSLRTHAPLANATVVLVERSQYATTDARGRFRQAPSFLSAGQRKISPKNSRRAFQERSSASLL